MLGISPGLAGCGVVRASNSQGANYGLRHAIFLEPVHSGMLPIAVYVVDGPLTSPAGLDYAQGTYSRIVLAFHPLSLAQLEERKTVTVQRAIVILRPAVRSREGRHFFCHLNILYRSRIVDVDGAGQNPIFGQEVHIEAF